MTSGARGVAAPRGGGGHAPARRWQRPERAAVARECEGGSELEREASGAGGVRRLQLERRSYRLVSRDRAGLVCARGVARAEAEAAAFAAGQPARAASRATPPALRLTVAAARPQAAVPKKKPAAAASNGGRRQSGARPKKAVKVQAFKGTSRFGKGSIYSDAVVKAPKKIAAAAIKKATKSPWMPGAGSRRQSTAIPRKKVPKVVVCTRSQSLPLLDFQG